MVDDYMSKPIPKKKTLVIDKLMDKRLNLFTPPSTRPQTMTPFTLGSKEDIPMKKMLSDVKV